MDASEGDKTRLKKAYEIVDINLAMTQYDRLDGLKEFQQ